MLGIFYLGQAYPAKGLTGTLTVAKNHTTGTVKRKSNIRLHSTDSVKRATNTRLHTTSVNKRLSGIARIHTTGINKRQSFVRFHSTDTMLSRPFSALTEDFNDNTFNSSLWSRYTSANVVEQNQRLEITTLQTTGDYYYLQSVNKYDLTGSYIHSQVVDAGNQAFTSLEVYPIMAYIDPTNYYAWFIGENTIRAYKRVGTATQIGTGLAYNSATMKYFRIREAAGTIYFDYSANGSSWTNYVSTANVLAINAMYAYTQVGTYQTEASATTVIIDNINKIGTPSYNRLHSTDTNKRKIPSSSHFTDTYKRGGSWTSSIMAWFYPGAPATNANVEYSDGRKIHFLKPEYQTVDVSGAIITKDAATYGVGGYTPANARDVVAKSDYAYYTISGDYADVSLLLNSSTTRNAAVTTIVNFLNQLKNTDLAPFDGVELDWEGYGQWTLTDYNNFKTFVTALATSLHAAGYKLMIDGPPIGDATEQGYYQWKYEDFNSLAVDYIVAMAYDWEYDFGGGTSISPTTRVQNVCDWVKTKITDINRIVIGMPSYGYHAPTGGFGIAVDTKAQSSTYTGYATATRNSDFEMHWTNAGIEYFYMDSQSLDSKRSVIEAKGIKYISVWHLGGNDWFASKAEAATSATRLHTTDTLKHTSPIRSHVTDTLKRSAVTRSHGTDVLKRKANSKIHTTDTLKRVTLSRSHSTDFVKRKATSRTLTTDTYKRIAVSKSHSADVNKVKTTVRTYSTDVNKRASTVRSHSTSTNKLKSGNAHVHTTDVNKLKSAVSRVHSTDVNKLKTGAIKTHATDIVKRLVTVKSHSTDILKRSIKVKSHTTDLLKRVSLTKTHTTDSFKRLSINQYHTTGTYLRKQNVQLHLTDTLKRAIVNKSHTTDTNKRLANATRFHKADINKRLGNLARVHSTDTLKRAGTIRLHTTDSVLRKTTSKIHTSDIFKRSGVARTHMTDVLKLKTNTRLHTADVNKRTSFIRSHSTSINKLKSGIVRVHTTDTNKRMGNILRVHSTDVNKLKSGVTRIHSTDGLKRVSTNRVHSTDALKRTSNFKSHLADTLKRMSSIKLHTTDVLKRKATIKAHSTDANKRLSGLTRTHSSDINLRKSGITKSNTTDIVKRGGNSQSHGTDVLKRSTSIKAHSTDVLKRQAITRAHSTDILKRKLLALQYTTDTLKRAQKTRTHSTDTLKRLSANRTHTSDALKRVATTRLHSTDVNKRLVNITRIHTTSVNRRMANLARNHTSDVLKRAIFTHPHSTDIVLRAIANKTHITDIYKRLGLSRLHSTDVNKQKSGVTRVHLTDTNKRKGGIARLHTSDVLKRVSSIKVHSSDALKRSANNIKLHSSDVLKRLGGLKSHATDTDKRKINICIHSTDILKRKATTRSHSTDTIKRQTNVGRSHTADTFKRSANSRSHTTDALRRAVRSLSHLTDTYKRRLLGQTHTTDIDTRSQNLLAHSTDLALRSRGASFFDDFSTYSGNYVKIDSTDSVSGWNISNDSTSVALNTTRFKEGTSSLEVSITPTATNRATISKTIPAKNLVGMDKIGFWVFVPSNTNSIRFQIRIGTNGSNYYEYRGVSIDNGWNFYELSLASPNATVGAPNLSSITLLQVDYFYSTGVTNASFIIDDIWAYINPNFTGNVWTQPNASYQYGVLGIQNNNGVYELLPGHISRVSPGNHGRALTGISKKYFSASYGVRILNVDTSESWGHRFLFDFVDGFNFAAVYISAKFNKAGIEQWIGNVRSYLEVPFTANIGKLYRVSVNVRGNTVSLYIDNVLITTYALPSQRQIGNYGFESYGGSVVGDNTTTAIREFKLLENSSVFHSTDINKRQSINLVHRTDLNKQKRLTHAHSTDVNKQKSGVSRIHTTNTLLRLFGTKPHTTDTFKRSTNIASHGTDVFKRGNSGLFHATNVYLRLQATINHSSDTLKRKSVAKSHNTDINKRLGAITRIHSTSSNKLKSNTKVHSTSASLLFARRINYVTNPSFEDVATQFWSRGGAGDSTGLTANFSDVTYARFGTKSVQLSAKGGTTSGQYYLNHQGIKFGLNRTYRLSAYVYIPVGSPITSINMGFRDLASYNYLDVRNFALVPGQWTRLSVTYKNVPNSFDATGQMRITVADPTGLPSDGTVCPFWIDGTMLEDVTDENLVIDPANNPSLDPFATVQGWNVGISSGGDKGVVDYASTNYALVGNTSVKIGAQTSTTQQSYLTYDFPVRRGERYDLTAWYFIPNTSSGSAGVRLVDTGNAFIYSNNSGAVKGSWQKLTVSYTVPSGGVPNGNPDMLRVNLYQSGGAEQYYDAIYVNKVTADPYFDGSFLNAGWTSAVNGSISYSLAVSPVVAHYTNTLLHKTPSVVHNTDTLKRKANIVTHNTDILKRKAVARTHTTDTLKRLSNLFKVHTTDFNKRINSIKVHATDTLKRKTGISRVHSTDALKRAMNSRLHTTDVLKRATKTKLHTTGTLKRLNTIKTHLTNVLKRKASIKTHLTSVNKRQVDSASHSVDTIKRSTNNAAHSTDVNKRLNSNLYHSTDVSLYAVVLTSHDTDVNKRKASAIRHSTDVGTLGSKIHKHTTDIALHDSYGEKRILHNGQWINAPVKYLKDGQWIKANVTILIDGIWTKVRK